MLITPIVCNKSHPWILEKCRLVAIKDLITRNRPTNVEWKKPHVWMVGRIRWRYHSGLRARCGWCRHSWQWATHQRVFAIEPTVRTSQEVNNFRWYGTHLCEHWQENGTFLQVNAFSLFAVWRCTFVTVFCNTHMIYCVTLMQGAGCAVLNHSYFSASPMVHILITNMLWIR
jgi:hypothetical protein